MHDGLYKLICSENKEFFDMVSKLLKVIVGNIRCIAIGHNLIISNTSTTTYKFYLPLY